MIRLGFDKGVGLFSKVQNNGESLLYVHFETNGLAKASMRDSLWGIIKRKICNNREEDKIKSPDLLRKTKNRGLSCMRYDVYCLTNFICSTFPFMSTN